MRTAIDAICEHGYLRLLSPLPLPDNTPVRVAIVVQVSGDVDRQAWLEQSERSLRGVWESASEGNAMQPRHEVEVCVVAEHCQPVLSG